MDIVYILRIIIGLPLVLFIPGFALTLALWPRFKKEVNEEVIRVLGEKTEKVYFLGNAEEYEDLIEDLKKKFKVGVYDTSFEGEKEVSKEEIENAEAVVVAENLGEQGIRLASKTIVDLTGSIPNAIAVEDTIDGIERLALSLGLSISIVPLLGLILNYTPFGIRLSSISVSLFILIVSLLGVYWYRRRRWNTSKSSQ
jgi:hypothetical protein